MKYFNEQAFKIKFGVAQVANFDFSNADGILGLARTNRDLTTSFIIMSYNAKITDSKLFSFKFATYNFNIPIGKLYIGRHKDFSKRHAFSCDLLDDTYKNLIFWTCELNAFGIYNIYNNIYSTKKTPIIFDTGTNFIILPYFYLEEMKDHLKNVGCRVIKYESANKENGNDEQYRLVCQSNNLPEFQFGLGKTKFIIPTSLTFFKKGQLAYSYIIFVKTISNQEPYVFGTPFFLSFHTLFNEDDKKLEFYPLDNDYIINNLFKYIIIISTITLIISISIGVYLVYRKNEKKKVVSTEYKSIISNDIEMTNKL
jgi:hypothetical protein